MVDGEKPCVVCGRAYDLERFRGLPLCGVENFGDEVDPFRLEFRECPCGNTLAVRIDRDGNPVDDERPF